MLQALYSIDSSILLWVQETFINDALTPIMTFITRLGNAGIFWIVLSAVLCINKKTRRTGVMCFMALIGSLLVNNIILKNLAARVRPYDAMEQVRLLVEAQKDFSFPSGHTGSSFAAASVIFFSMKKRYGVPCMLFAALIGFTRLYVGVHYPSDVLVGMVDGILIGYIVVKKLSKKLCQEKILDITP